MLRGSATRYRPIRPYYNLPSKSEHGRRMTGFLTPYRHWMWKQNELWRNVHEAQFEHLRKVYKRQWLESFRVNADEYIYKYNITKAAQLAQWEYEMEAQEKKRREAQQLAHGRQALKKKHLDLLREFHERQFFYWYERASERLQYMNYIQYVPQSDIQAHIDRELDKFVAGSKAPYPLNFAGQMPLLEDAQGNIVQAHGSLLVNHESENQDASATEYTAPESASLAEDQLLQMMVSAQEEELRLKSDDSRALSEALSDIEKEEALRESSERVAVSMEETDEEREINKRAYIDRGKTGSRDTIRPPRFGDDDGGKPKQEDTTAPKRTQLSRKDKIHALQRQQDEAMNKLSYEIFGKTGVLDDAAKVGEVVENRGQLRSKVAVPSMETLMSIPEIAAGSGSRVQTNNLFEKRYKLGKYKEKGQGEDQKSKPSRNNNNNKGDAGRRGNDDENL